MAKYAAKSSVPIERSQSEIQKTIIRYGADCYALMHEPGVATIGFRLDGRYYRLTQIIPDNPQSARQMWRIILLLLKAKFEVIAAGHSTAEKEFMASLVMPNGNTVGQALSAQIEDAYSTGKQPKLLLLGQ